MFWVYNVEPMRIIFFLRVHCFQGTGMNVFEIMKMVDEALYQTEAFGGSRVEVCEQSGYFV